MSSLDPGVRSADVRRLFKALAVAMVPLALLMLVEKTTELNPFGDLGGVNPVPTV